MIIQADILEWCEAYDGPLFHAALMDAPYEMEFMGKGWDNTGIAFNPETWKAIARHLLPGAFLFVCAGTINDDLISVAMRQAGLRKYHKAMAWGYGSGFPKATRLDVQIDRAVGATRQKVGTKKHQPKFDAKGFEYRKKDNGFNSKDRATFDVTAPATELAQAWQGYRYGGQMLKPALETILIFQKPYQGRPVECITRTGAGALNIAGGRIVGDVNTNDPYFYTGDNGNSMNTASERLRTSGGGARDPAGRWPANLILQHSPLCEPIGTRRVRSPGLHADQGGADGYTRGLFRGNIGTRQGHGHADADGLETIPAWSCAPGCAVAALSRQSGERLSGGSEMRSNQRSEFLNGLDAQHRETYTDTGTAARFFFNAGWEAEKQEAQDPLMNLRSDLTDEQRQYVIAELERAGVV